MSRWFRRYPLGVLLALASSLLLTGVAGAQPVAAAGFTGVHNAAAVHQCLDMTNGSNNRGTQAQVWTCDGRQQQFWQYIYTPTGLGGYLIQNRKSLLCLSVLNNSLSPGAPVIQWPCDSSDPWENWDFFYVPQVNLYGLALDPSGMLHALVVVPSHCNTASGSKIVLGTADGCPNAELWFNG
jgi:hypothetical protein